MVAAPRWRGEGEAHSRASAMLKAQDGEGPHYGNDRHNGCSHTKLG